MPEKQTDVNGKSGRRKKVNGKTWDGMKINNEHVMPSILLGRIVHQTDTYRP